MDYHYRLNCGQYVLHDGDTPLQRPLDEVALLIDTRDGTLCKHGDPASVAAWHTTQQRGLIAAGLQAWAEALVCVTGKPELEDLNRCLAISGYAGRWLAKASSPPSAASG